MQNYATVSTSCVLLTLALNKWFINLSNKYKTKCSWICVACNDSILPPNSQASRIMTLMFFYFVLHFSIPFLLAICYWNTIRCPCTNAKLWKWKLTQTSSSAEAVGITLNLGVITMLIRWHWTTEAIQQSDRNGRLETIHTTPHLMMTSSNGPLCGEFTLLGNSSVTGELPSQRPVTRSFDVFFDLRLNKRLSKQTIVRLVILGAIALIMTSLKCMA